MHLFVYGSLMIPAVMRAVTGRVFSRTEARLVAYARYRVREASYPGIVAQDGVVTSGVLLYRVDPRSLARLDAFEGELYERKMVSVQRADGFAGSAGAYVVRRQFRNRLSHEPWDPMRFEAEQLQQFLIAHGGFP